MRKSLRVVALSVPLFLIAPNSYAGVKAGSACSKLGSKVLSVSKTFTCVKSGKKLVWDSGVLISTAKSSSNGSTNSQSVSEGSSCLKMGQQVTQGSILLECRKFAGNKLEYIAITNVFSPLSNPSSPDPLSLCQLADKRTQIPTELKDNIPLSIAYPPKPFSNFGSATGTFKIVVVGVDFSDAPGSGSPSEIWKEDLAKAKDWMNWYSNGKVSLNFVTYPEWLRAPKPSFKYDASNNGNRGSSDVQSGGLTAQEISDDYIHTIEKAADLTDALSIWVYLPTDISTPFGAFQPASANVKSNNYGLVKSQLVLTSADIYLSNRIRYAYFLHEMIHGFGLQGHSPKFIPTGGFLNKNGMMSNADGWTQALLPWDAIVWGVASSSDTYCIDKSHLTEVNLKLVPLEREQLGLRSAIIRLNDHQALVVESHRSDKYGVGEGPGFAGTMVSIIDTTKSTMFENENSPRDPCLTSTGIYLRVENGNHGKHAAIGTPLMRNGQNYNGVTMFNGVAIAGDQDPWDLNHVMYPGDSISAAGVKVTLAKGGDNDLVRIENVDKSVSEFEQAPLPPECLSRLVPISQNISGVSNSGPSSANTSRDNGFQVSKDLAVPFNLVGAAQNGSITLNWNFAVTGKVKTEYVRIRGECVKAGTSCGNYTNDIWNLPSENGPMTSILSQSMLGSNSIGGQWKFWISVANQSARVTSSEIPFEPLIL